MLDDFNYDVLNLGFRLYSFPLQEINASLEATNWPPLPVLFKTWAIDLVSVFSFTKSFPQVTMERNDLCTMYHPEISPYCQPENMRSCQNLYCHVISQTSLDISLGIRSWSLNSPYVSSQEKHLKISCFDSEEQELDWGCSVCERSMGWGSSTGHRESSQGSIGLTLIKANRRRSGIAQEDLLIEMRKSDGSRLSCCVPDFKRKTFFLDFL